MAWYHNNHYSVPETGYKIVGYAESQESYMARTEQVVEYRGHAPGLIRGFKHSPPRKDLHKDHKVDHGKPTSFLVPWSSPHGSPRKADQGHFSPPRLRDEGLIHGKSPMNGYSNSPRYNQGKYNNHVYDTSDEEDDDVDCRDGVCVKRDFKSGQKPRYLNQDDDYDYGYDHDYKDNEKKGKGYVPSAYTHPSSTNDRPRKDTYYDKPLIDTHKNHEEHKGNSGYAPFNSNHSVPMKTQQPRKDTHYETPNTVHNYEKNKGNGYNPQSNYISAPHSNYSSAPMTTQAPNTVHYEKNKGNGYTPQSDYTSAPHSNYSSAPKTTQAPNTVNYEKNKGNGYAPSSTYNYSSAPMTTQPRKNKDTYYDHEKNNGNGYDHFKNQPPETTTKQKKEAYFDGGPRFSGPPIKTRRDAHSHDYRNGNGRSSPVAHQTQYVNSPRKDETIDSAEAKRRYGGVSVPLPAGDQKHSTAETIDSIEAARRYNGVFVHY